MFDRGTACLCVLHSNKALGSHRAAHLSLTILLPRKTTLVVRQNAPRSVPSFHHAATRDLVAADEHQTSKSRDLWQVACPPPSPSRLPPRRTRACI